MKIKILIFSTLIMISGMAQSEKIVKIYHNDIYFKDIYSFTLTQVWESEESWGEPVPLPWKVSGYIYADNTGLEKLFEVEENIMVYNNPEWLKQSKWKSFKEINYLPMDIVYTDEGQLGAFIKVSTQNSTDKNDHGIDLSAFIGGFEACINGIINYSGCRTRGIFGTNQCPFSSTMEELIECYEDQIEIWLRHVDKSDPRSISVFSDRIDSEDKGVIYTTKIDMYHNDASFGINESGQKPYLINFNKSMDIN